MLALGGKCSIGDQLHPGGAICQTTYDLMAIQRSLEELAAGRTTLVIAHRLSTAARAACIIVLDGDHITETGVHADLLTRNGRYSMLWRAFEHEAAVGAG
jgi:hypothetical protein